MFPKTVGAAFLSLCSSINTPRSLTCSLLWQHGEHRQLAELSISALDYKEEQLEKFRDDYLVTEYLSKYTGLVTGVDTAKVAYDSFAAAELKCKKANRRIRQYPSRVGGSLHLGRVITRAQALIEGCIRTSPSFQRMSESSRWGQGSTFSLKGEEVRIDAKVCEGQISVTKRALPFVRAAMAEDIALLRARGIYAEGPTSMVDSEFCIVQGSRGLTVPKNAKTDRFIAAEPTGNIFIQLGFGSLLRSCLQRCGIDLDSQKLNQELARLALELGLATVDLKAASDTICEELVWLLLPFRWAYALDCARSDAMLVNGVWVPLSKFSSMGNGFTFELESLIFWALTQAVCDAEMHSGRVSVYGDDIVCPTSAVRTLREVMDFCGFEVNTKKTHTNSLFRESCGEHYFNGYNVRPIYQKETLESVEAYYRFHNRWVYHASHRGAVYGNTLLCDKKLRNVVRIAAYNRLDRPHLIPISADRETQVLDGGLVTDSRRLKLKYRGDSFVARTWVFEPFELAAWEDALYAVHLRQKRHVRPTPNFYLAHKAKTEAVANPRMYVSMLKERRDYKATGTDLGIAFAGMLTIRGQGNYRSRNRRYSQSCDLRWV